MSTATLFTISRTWKQIKCPSADEWIKMWYINTREYSVQFSCSGMSDFLQPHKPQHVTSPCPLPTPRAHPNSCPLSQWCHPTISSSAIPFSSCPQSIPESGSSWISQLFTSGGQSIGVSASTSVLLMNAQDDLLYYGLVGSPCSPRNS